jgi:lytic cellulose monooxygenase (C4-dehydrogenating)
MWNWNGLYRNGSLDTVGAWKTTNVADDFTLRLYDQASHGAVGSKPWRVT